MEALKALLISDPENAICLASDDDIRAAITDPKADPIVQLQAAAILNGRIAVREWEESR